MSTLLLIIMYNFFFFFNFLEPCLGRGGGLSSMLRSWLINWTEEKSCEIKLQSFSDQRTTLSTTILRQTALLRGWYLSEARRSQALIMGKGKIQMDIIFKIAIAILDFSLCLNFCMSYRSSNYCDNNICRS